MRLWRRKRREFESRSPFDAETIRPGDPGWAIFEAAMTSGKPVIGTYDTETGEVVSIDVVEDE